jgi:hypothetical protein
MSGHGGQKNLAHPWLETSQLNGILKYPTMWEIRLKSKSEFLEILPKYYSNDALRVVQSGEEYFLRSDRFSEITDKGALCEYGEELVRFINVSYELTYQVDPEIVSNGHYRSVGGTKERQSMFRSVNLSLRIQNVVYSLDKNLQSDWFNIWENNENVRDAYRLLSGPIDWFSLFKIYETIRDDNSHGCSKKGIKAIIDWSTAGENESFFDTANYYRHAMFGKHREQPNSPPSNDMTIYMAEVYIRKLLEKWLEGKTLSK